ncbi:MAG TPA: hypothetical protein VER17_06715 [Tepidisphaeraceae bacterium]|nr:hypothetical protein [Tepidisphaeraceae bacterium]
MTVRDDADQGLHRRDTGDHFEVARGVPADRVRWGPILAGTFAALTALAILGTLGAAIGMSSYDRDQDDVRNFAMAGGVWGILSTIVAFALGGWVTARSAAVHGRDNGLLNGALVAAVGIPLMLFLFGSAATAMSSAEVANGRDQQARGQSDNNAMTAAARIGDTATGGDKAPDARANPPADDADRARRAGGRTAWAALTAMILAVGASAAAGYAGARRDHDHHRDHRAGGAYAGDHGRTV